MNKNETIQILMMIQAAFPNFKVQDKTVSVNLWNMMLEEYDYTLVVQALKAYIATDASGFAPTVGKIIDKCQSLMLANQNELVPTEAWALVSNALRNSTYNSKAEFDKLPEPVQKAVGSPSVLYAWATDDKFSEGVASSNFMKSYTQIMAKKREHEALPESVKKLMGIASNGQNLIGG